MYRKLLPIGIRWPTRFFTLSAIEGGAASREGSGESRHRTVIRSVCCEYDKTQAIGQNIPIPNLNRMGLLE